MSRGKNLQEMEARACHLLELRRLAGGPHIVKIGLYKDLRTRIATHA